MTRFLGISTIFRAGGEHLIAGLRRAGRYRPLIQRILDEEGVPQELIHLAQAESGFFPRALSRKAAAGMWQFVAWRGEYGLKQTRLTMTVWIPRRRPVPRRGTSATFIRIWGLVPGDCSI